MFKYFILLIISISLSSCQNNKNEVDLQKKQRNDAASYNIQLGLEYLKQGNVSRSKKKLLLALEQAPNSSDVNAAMAYFLEKTGDVDKANVYYKKALAASHSGAQLNNYGAFLCRQGKYSEAESYFLKAVNDLNYEHTAGAYENAGLCAEAANESSKAQVYFIKALEKDPSRRESVYELVRLDIKQGNFNEALAILQKYPEAVLHSQKLLKLAVLVSHKANKLELEAEYKRLLEDFS